ncbi:hypothetical protein EON65_16920 [archaeon]|nr:MAG: hypothetical protein EON65_16920 [archaeon]
MLQLAAMCEVYQGIFHIIELFLPSRNILQLYLWWQYLKVRYMTDRSGQMKIAFGEVDGSLMQLFNHQ